jgi:uncharacterized protein
MRVGLISDTHGLLRPEALVFLESCDHIIHAGDICDDSVLQAIARLAPLTAVRGNNDKGSWADLLAETELVKIGDAYVYVIHDLAALDIDPEAAGVQVVISGHSHQPKIESRDGVLFVNPGSAGPRRFRLPITVAELSIVDGIVSARIVALEAPSAA